MGFIKFLGGAVKVLAGGAVFILGILAMTPLMMAGESGLALVAFIIALVGGLYAQYNRGRQSQRMRGVR